MPDHLDEVLQVNLRAPALLAARIGKAMAEAGSGSIINLASTAGIRALSEHYVYCMTKAALIMATKVLALELGPSGVRANAICPTVTLTEMGQRVWLDHPDKAAPMLDRIPARPLRLSRRGLGGGGLAGLGRGRGHQRGGTAGRRRPARHLIGSGAGRNRPGPPAGCPGMRLSVLDLVPVRAGQTTAQALAASVRLAQVADAAGMHRYWVAEHHNMPAVAATNPPVLIAMLAGATERIRVGSGGVMLPNHAPLVVAEQFALLEAAYPGRIDLGIGRAPGSDPVTNWALRHGGPETADAEHFGVHVDNLIAMLEPDGVGLALQGRTYALRATPQSTGRPDVWLLGSSDFSAQLAASKGLPYVFAHHFSGSGTAAGAGAVPERVRALRSRQPTDHLPDRERRGRREPGRGRAAGPAEPVGHDQLADRR